MIKVGLLGRGGISKAHTAAYKKLAEENKGVKIVACCDIRPEVLEDMGDIRKYTDMDTFLQEEQGKLDYVDICLPTYLHCEAAVKAMRAGFNVLSEKPMALNVEQAEEMIAVSKETGKQFMIAQCCRFMGASKIIREYVENGKLGKVRSAEFYREGGSRNPMGYQNWFRDEKLSGGAMLDLHVHDVDYMRSILGMPKAVSAMAQNVVPGGGYDAMSVNYMYENNVFANAKCDWTIKGDKFNTRAVRVNFEEGYIYLDRTENRTTFVCVDADGNLEDWTDKIDADMFYNELIYYTDCLKNNKPVDYCPPTEARDAIKIVMAEMKSADLGGALVTL